MEGLLSGAPFLRSPDCDNESEEKEMSVSQLPHDWYNRDRLEWRTASQPYSLTARRYHPDEGSTLWVATQCGVYAGDDALLEKHREMLDAHNGSAVTVKFQVITVDLEAMRKRERLQTRR